MSCEADDNVYVDAQYTNSQVVLTQVQPNDGRPEVPSRNPPRLDQNQSQGKWAVISTAIGATVIILIVVNISLTVVNGPGTSTRDVSGTSSQINSVDYPRSCNELLIRGGSSKSGIYTLRPDKNSFPIEVYCDMETDGGGWSLVASIHESDIQRKCYTDDLWSAYIPEGQMSLEGKTSWDNEMIFGSVQKCIEDDYKNFGYFRINASDLMVWHVQLGFHVDHVRTRSTFRYRTTNQFLRNYGGNLRTLFGKYFPLKPTTDDTNSKLLQAMTGKSKEIKSRIPNWYDYPAGTGSYQYSITDSSMYQSSGSQIQFRSSSRSYGFLLYGQEYRFYSSHSKVKTSTSVTPFMLIATIGNEDLLDSYYEIQVYSSGRSVNPSISIPELEGSVTQGNFTLQYKAVQFFDPSLNSPCEMFFVVTNSEEWSSKEQSSFRRTYQYYGYTNRQTYYRIEGNPTKLLFGYILLASKIGNNFTTENLDNVSAVILQAISTVKDDFKVPSTRNTLTVPIVFDKGGADEIANTIPLVYRPYVEPGYLQFRAYNYTGYPNAICPGAKVSSHSPEFVCIGGVSGDTGQYGTCGDFAGWGGKSTDKILPSLPSGSAHSHKDILSTILLFYR